MNMKKAGQIYFLMIFFFCFSQGNLFSAVTLKDCVEKGGEAVEERGYTKCSGGDYDEQPVLSPDFEENAEAAIPLSEPQNDQKIVL